MNDDLYRGVTDFAHGQPGWLHAVVEYGTDGGVLVLLLLLATAWWRARHAAPRAMALTLLGLVSTAAAYAVSETAKSLIKEERPCRAVADAVASVAPCPEVGDWSFPSNHATIAAAAAVGLALAWRATAAFALPLALLMAFSRVFLGVHYPFDVTAGALLGTVMALSVAALFVRSGTTLVTRLRTGALRPLLGAGPSLDPRPDSGRTAEPARAIRSERRDQSASPVS